MANLGAMVANARINLSEASDGFFDSTHIKYYIGEGFRKYSTIMIEEGDGYFETTVNVGFTAQVDSIDLSLLSPTFFHISALEKNTTTGTYPLKKSERRFKSNSTFIIGSGDAYRPDYKFRSLNLVLEPTPRSTEAGTTTTGLKLDYIYVPTFPTAASLDTFVFDANFPTIYEAMVELYAAIATLEAKDAMGGVSDIATLRVRLQNLEETFNESLERSEYPDSVDYVGIDYGNFGDWRY